VTQVESQIDALNEELEPLKNFVLPGGSESASRVHLARACCRRGERVLVALAEDEEVNECALQFVNRLSDYLFVLSRYVVLAEGKAEVLWQPKASPKRPS